jgi:predicted  nucleic acid-binding Zn-ribbon protein
MVKVKIEKKASKTLKQIMTLDKLALMVARGFDQVDRRFVRVELDNQVVRNDLSDVKQDISHVKLELKEVNFRLDNMENKIDDLAKSDKQDIDILFKDVGRIKQKVGLK